jgi:hypothetical protein
MPRSHNPLTWRIGDQFPIHSYDKNIKRKPPCKLWNGSRSHEKNNFGSMCASVYIYIGIDKYIN